MTRVGIFGATGYTGFELIRLLLSHPGATVAALSSEQYADLSVDQAFPPFKGLLAGAAFGRMESLLSADIEVAFLALPHTVSSSVVPSFLGRGVKVVDLSADFRFRSIARYESVYAVRHKSPGLSERASYGLPEVHRDRIRGSDLVAVPGCFPTAVILGLFPLLAAGLVEKRGIVADCKTGVSGGGRGPTLGFHYPEVEGGVRPYGLPAHRHNPEMDQELSLAAGEEVHVAFVPHLLPMVRGILATCYATLAPGAGPGDVEGAFRSRYGKEPFVRLCPPGALPSTKDVRGSNFCDIAVRILGDSGQVVVVSAIDNLVKGASGAAVQCFNLMTGRPEGEGLWSAPVFP